jgi:cell wall-associated NlpC family hydrolase
VNRSLLLLAALVALACGSARAAGPDRPWAHAEIDLVISRGLMAADVASFRPDDPLTQRELAELVGALTRRPSGSAGRADAPVTIATLDARLVRALGMQDAAAGFARAARAAGIPVPSRFGTEVVARLLGLRTNHPAALDALEALPGDPASRAEAAFSTARVLRFRGNESDYAREAAASFTLPPLSAWQRRVLTVAFWLVGYPYVWGGESELASSPFGLQARGGFDCSGFVWRVYKLQRYPDAPALAGTLRGRTTFAMSAEVPRERRIPLSGLEPADVVFFGAEGPRSKPRQVDHMGIYVGGGWMVHSSRYGVALVPLTGWYAERFAWARRPLAEAGLA